MQKATSHDARWYNDNIIIITAHICQIAPVLTNIGYYMLQDRITK